MSEHKPDIAHPRIASYPFNEPSADITLRTRDGVDFYVYRPILSLASPVFADMFSLPQPATPKQDQIIARPVIDITEDSKTIERLLRLCYPIEKEKLDEFEDIVAVLQAAMKYDMKWPISSLTVDLLAIVPHSPLKVWAIACRCRAEDLAHKAAARMLEMANAPPERTAKDSDVADLDEQVYALRGPSIRALTLLRHKLEEYGLDMLDGISAGDYFRLREYLRVGEGKITSLLSPTTVDVNHSGAEWTQDAILPTVIPSFPPPDVVLQCSDGRQFPAHSLPFILHSPVLSTRIHAACATASQPIATTLDDRPLPVLEIEVEFSTLSTLIVMLYAKDVRRNLPRDLPRLSAVLDTARKLEIAGL